MTTDTTATSTMTDYNGNPVVMTGELDRDRTRRDGRPWFAAVVEFTEDGWACTRVVGGSVRGAVVARRIAAEWALRNLAA